ncbi:MAG: hypothetical protein COA99_15875 [Moraxellaceae bacterium]|nr:MAG: hypothetical protein COA99_15875 [Moraxellaceae bacterium]
MISIDTDGLLNLSPAELITEVQTLKQKLAELEQSNQDLQVMLDTSVEHGDHLTGDLEAERDDLNTMLELATEHGDTVEDELYDRVESTLRKSEQQLRLIVEATPTPVIILRLADNEIVYANAMMGVLFDVSVSVLLGRKSIELYCDASVHDRLLLILATQGGVDRSEVCLRRHDGADVWVEISLRQLEFNDEPSVLCGIHDITHLKAMNRAANRFVPKEYLEFLNKNSISDITLGDHVTGEMTVMFSDLRGFTSLSENMSPQENFAFINAYFGRVSPIVREHKGFIIKYLGDGIHGIFPQRADDGVRAGIAQLRKVQRYNEYRVQKGRLPIAVGIGVNTGYMMVGMVGEHDRMQGDAFSDEVNLTARIEGLTKFYGTHFIISDATRQRLNEPTTFDIRFLDRVQVAGRKGTLDLYEVYDADPPEMRALKQETQIDYEQALDLYYDRQFDAAQLKLFGVLQRNPRDKPAWHHLVNATRLADTGAPEGWTGVTVMNKK